MREIPAGAARVAQNMAGGTRPKLFTRVGPGIVVLERSKDAAIKGTTIHSLANGEVVLHNQPCRLVNPSAQCNPRALVEQAGIPLDRIPHGRTIHPKSIVAITDEKVVLGGQRHSGRLITFVLGDY